jgi:hypothetical protein
MWLERILGSVTCARAGNDAVNVRAAPGSKMRKSRDRGFKGNLSQDWMPEDLSPQSGAEILENGTLPDATVSGQRFPRRSLPPSMPSPSCWLILTRQRLFVNCLVRGRHHLAPKDAETLAPENLSALTASSLALQNPRSEGILAPGAAAASTVETEVNTAAYSSQKEMKAKHE